MRVDSITQALEEATKQLIALGNTALIIAFAMAIIPYILFAIGLSSVADACRIRHRWMAWIPFARKHLLAEIADIRRVQTGKQKKLATQYEICMVAFLGCLYALIRSDNPVFLVIPAIVAALLSYNQAFSYYYFYRLCDRENATAYFLLGLIAKPLNSFFVYHCR